MFEFIESDDLENQVTNEYIDEVERKLKIKFPNILREYYLKHNFAKEKECVFRIQGIDADFILDCIIPLKYGTIHLEKEYQYVLQDEYIPNEYIPLAYDIDSELYYWNSKTETVYFISHENVENPIVICNSVGEFFEVLNRCSTGEVVILENLNKIDLLKYNYLNGNSEKIEVDKILKYNGEFIFTCILIGLFFIILSLVLIPFTDSLSIILGGAVGVYVAIFLIIDIINRIKSYCTLKKYDISLLKEELKSAIKLNKEDTYLTKNYIISNTKTIKITRYSEIEWAFYEDFYGTERQRLTVSSAYKIGGYPIRAYLHNGKNLIVAKLKHKQNIKFIYAKINNENSNALIGYTFENQKKYKKRHQNYRKRLNANQITWMILGIIIIAYLIYGIIN